MDTVSCGLSCTCCPLAQAFAHQQIKQQQKADTQHEPRTGQMINESKMSQLIHDSLPPVSSTSRELLVKPVIQVQNLNYTQINHCMLMWNCELQESIKTNATERNLCNDTNLQFQDQSSYPCKTEDEQTKEHTINLCTTSKVDQIRYPKISIVDLQQATVYFFRVTYLRTCVIQGMERTWELSIVSNLRLMYIIRWCILLCSAHKIQIVSCHTWHSIKYFSGIYM